MNVYRIRDRNTGLFTDGGRHADINFNKNGKIWLTLKSVIAFLNYFSKDNLKTIESNLIYENLLLKKIKKPLKIIKLKEPVEYIPENWEIVEYNLEESDVFSAKVEIKKT